MNRRNDRTLTPSHPSGEDLPYSQGRALFISMVEMGVDPTIAVHHHCNPPPLLPTTTTNTYYHHLPPPPPTSTTPITITTHHHHLPPLPTFTSHHHHPPPPNSIQTLPQHCPDILQTPSRQPPDTLHFENTSWVLTDGLTKGQVGFLSCCRS